MRLTGQQQYVAGMERSAAATKALGTAASTTGAQAKAGAAGIDAMNASAATGVGAMGRMSAMGKKASLVGGKLTSSFAAPFALVAAGSIKMSMDFWGAMRLIQTSAGASEEQMQKYGDAVLDLASSGRVTESPEELANALYKVVSGGFKGTEAMHVLEKATELAAVSQSDLETTTYALVAAQNTGIKGTANLDKTIGTLNATVGAGNMKMDDLTASFSSGIVPAAKGVGLSLTDVGAAIATMTKRGIPASKAANNLKLAFTKMSSPSGSALEALESIGLSQHAMATAMRGPRGLPTALGLLKSKLDGLSKNKQADIINEVFGGARGGSTMLTLIQNLDDVNARFDSIRDNTGKLKGDLDDVRNTRGFKLKASLSQLKSAMVQLGDIMGPVLVPMLTKLVGWLGKIVQGFGKLPKPVQTFITAGFAILAFAGPVLMFFGSLVTAIELLTPVVGALGTAVMFLISPVGLIILGIAALAVGFYIAYKKVGWFRDGVDAVFKWLKNAVGNVINFVKQHWKLIIAYILGPISLLVYGIVTHWGDIKKATSNAWNFVKNKVVGAVNSVLGFVKGHWKLLVGILLGPFALAVAAIMQYWGTIKSGAKAVVSFVKGGFSSLVGFFRSMPGRMSAAATGLFDGIKDAFKNAINWVITTWNNLEFQLPSAKVFGKEIGGGSIGTPDIPPLAAGGHIMGSGLALIGEAGPELLHLPRGATVEPLHRQSMGRVQRSASGGGGARRSGRDGNTYVTVQLDRKTIATAVARAAEDDEARQ